MNRYELHQKLKEAETKGFKAGFDEGRKQPAIAGLGHPVPRRMPSIEEMQRPAATLPDGKYRCVVEVAALPMRGAYEVRAVLYIGRKYYNAKQIMERDSWQYMQANRDHFTRWIQSWLDGAYKAMWSEFKKDIVFDMPPGWDEAVQETYRREYRGTWEPQHQPQRPVAPLEDIDW